MLDSASEGDKLETAEPANHARHRAPSDNARATGATAVQPASDSTARAIDSHAAVPASGTHNNCTPRFTASPIT